MEFIAFSIITWKTHGILPDLHSQNVRPVKPDFQLEIAGIVSPFSRKYQKMDNLSEKILIIFFHFITLYYVFQQARKFSC